MFTPKNNARTSMPENKKERELVWWRGRKPYFFTDIISTNVYIRGSVGSKMYMIRNILVHNETFTHPNGMDMVMTCGLHAWLSLQSWWKSIACFQGNYKSFCFQLDVCIDACRFNHLNSVEVTLQTVLPSENYLVQEKKCSFRSHTQKTVLISYWNCFGFVSRIQCMQRP